MITTADYVYYLEIELAQMNTLSCYVMRPYSKHSTYSKEPFVITIFIHINVSHSKSFLQKLNKMCQGDQNESRVIYLFVQYFINTQL